MSKFTVKVDLSLFFEDERKNVIILVDPSLSTVDKFQKRVEELFNLKNLRFQTLDGSLVPAQESIEIIKYVQELRVFTGKLRKQSKPLLEVNNNDIRMVESEASVNNRHQTKRKFISLENGLKISPLSSAKRTRNWVPTLLAIKHNESNEITSTQNDIEVLKVEASVNKGSPTERPLTSKQSMAATNDADNSARDLQKLSNISDKSNKTLSRSHSNSSKSHSSKTNSFASSTLIECNDKSCTEQQSLHIQSNRSQVELNKIFNLNENGNAVTLIEPKSNKPNILFRCALEHNSADTTTARVFQIIQKKISEIPKPKIIIQDQVIIQTPLHTEREIEKANCSATSEIEKENCSATSEMMNSAKDSSPSSDSSVMELDEENSDTEESSVIELNETVDEESPEEETSNGEKDSVNVAKLLEQATDLPENTLPSVGDILLFKLPYNSKNESVISDYVAGPCEYVNKRTKTVKVCVTDGKHELPNLSPIYGSNLDDSFSTITSLNFKLVNMISPKIIKMN